MADQSVPSRAIEGWENFLPALPIFLALEALGAVVYLVSIPGDAKNTLLFGLSLPRLALTVILLILCALLASFSWRLWRRSSVREQVSGWLFHNARRPGLAVAGILAAFLFLWFASYIPEYRLGEWTAYYQRVRPFLLWLWVASGEIFVFLSGWLYSRGKSTLAGQLGDRKSLFRSVLVALTVLLVVWALVAFTGVGIGPGSNFWNKAGVPLVGAQILAAWLAAVFVLMVSSNRQNRTPPFWIDIFLCLLVWAMASWFWSAQPIAASRFNTSAFPPNFTNYPFSDAQDYDVNAQSILLGQGFQIYFLDKPLHSALLITLHLLAGQDFSRVINLQVMLLAFFPVLLYLLGKTFHSRGFGVLLALLALFRELNAIQATNLIMVSNVKMLLSEPLTALGLAGFALWLVKWFKGGGRSFRVLAVASAWLGLTALVRLNVLILLPLVFLAAFYTALPGWRRWFTQILTVILVTVACLTPWMARNAVIEGDPLRFVHNKVTGVLFKNRFQQIMNNKPAIGSDPSSSRPTPAPDKSVSKSDGISAIFIPVASSFAHNLVASALVLPPSFLPEDLLHTIRLSYWDLEWKGDFSPFGQGVMAVNFALIALGLGSSWRRLRMGGLVPLLIFIGYQASNALSVVSGGRYIVPVDWVVYFYFSAGLMELSGWIMLLSGVKLSPPAGLDSDIQRGPLAQSVRLLKGLSVGLIFLLLASTPAVLEGAFPQHYTLVFEQRSLQESQTRLASFKGYSITDLVKQSGGVAVVGRALYPRFAQPGEGDTNASQSVFGRKAYPHLSFHLLGQNGYPVILSLENSPGVFPNGTEVVVAGCRNGDTIDALAVIPLESSMPPILRSPGEKWACPLLPPQ